MTTTPTASPELPDLEALRKIGILVTTQDNRITDQPMFIVQQRRRMYGLDTGYCENFIWLCSEDEYNEASADEADALEAEYQDTGRAKDGWQRTGYIDQWEFVTACFTEQGCIDYLKLDGHNLNEPRIYAEGSYRNEEFRAVRNSLIALARRAQPEGEAPQAVYQFRAMNMNDWIECDAGCHDRLKAQESAHLFEFRTLYAAATLSPLCGAQHAESGKEAQCTIGVGDGFGRLFVHGDYDSIMAVRSIIIENEYLRAAQHAAAPGAGGRSLDPEATRAIRRAVRYLEENDCTGPAADLNALLDTPAATSAPGTPEAPKGSIGDLTEFHVLLNWYDNEASYGSINEGRNKLTEYIDKWADRRAAQLDGGQEGSESNG